MALFLALTSVEGLWPARYIWLYMTKVVLVSGSLMFYRETWKDYHIEWRVVAPAIIVGLFVFAEWIPVDRLLPAGLHFSGGKRTALDPFSGIHDPGTRDLFLAFRIFGLALMVPFMEELFWRSFLLRFASNPDADFRLVPTGTFSWGAFAIVAGAFALSHPEWLSALICGVAYGLLLWRTRSLFAPFIAHAVTNLALGIYILQTHNWAYW